MHPVGFDKFKGAQSLTGRFQAVAGSEEIRHAARGFSRCSRAPVLIGRGFRPAIASIVARPDFALQPVQGSGFRDRREKQQKAERGRQCQRAKRGSGRRKPTGGKGNRG